MRARYKGAPSVYKCARAAYKKALEPTCYSSEARVVPRFDVMLALFCRVCYYNYTFVQEKVEIVLLSVKKNYFCRANARIYKKKSYGFI